MRDIFIKKGIIAVVLLLLVMSTAHAADRYWIGAGGAVNTWNNTANWSTASGGAGGASVPGTSDVAIFDANGLGNCNIDIAVDIAGINVASGYTGTISQGANTITVGSSNAIFSGGTFTGGSATIIINGSLTISGTAFASTSNVLTVAGNYTLSSGSFTHNNGAVQLTTTSTLTGSTSFYDLELAAASTAATFTVASGTVLTVTNGLTYSGSSSIAVSTGVIEAQGNITLNNIFAGGGGNGTLKINGSGNQTVTGTAALDNGLNRLPNVEINKPSGTLTFKNRLTVAGNWTYIAGNIDASTFGSSVYFIGVRTITGTHSLHHVLFAGGTYTISSGTSLTVLGDLSTKGTSSIVINTGIIEAKGNITLGTSFAGGGGTATLMINGSGNQLLTGQSSLVNTASRLPNVVIDKVSGTLTLDKCFAVAGDWTYLQGNINPGTSIAHFVGSKTITGSHTLNQIIFNGSLSAVYTIASGTTLTAMDDVTFSGASAITLNTGTLEAMGDVLLNNTASAGGGSATIKFAGQGDQTFQGTTTSYLNRLCNIEINKALGTLYLQNILTVFGNWNYVQGVINAGTSEVIFHGSKTISGTHTLYSISFSAGTYSISNTITAMGTLSTIYTGDIYLNTGTIEAKGDIVLSNTGNGNGGSGTINISGDGDQTFKGSGTAYKSRLGDINIDKPSGTLYLQNLITVVGDWNYVQGTVDAGTSTLIFQGAKTISGTHSLYNVTFPGAIYTISGTLTVNGTLRTELSGDTQINTGTIVANGNITLNNTGNGSGGTGTIKISGDADQSFTGNGIATAGRLCNVLINKPSGTLTLSSIISCGGNWTYEQGKVDASTNSSTVVLLATKNLDAEGAAGVMSFHHLNIFNNTRTITDELNVAGNLSISTGATLTNTTHSFNVGGSWSNSGTYNAGTAVVTFNGAGDIQTIRKSSGAETFYGLAVNKEAGYVGLDGAVTVTHSLSLSKGNIASTSTNLLTLNDIATVTGGSDASYVSGPMKKVGNDAFTFPLGGTSGGANYYHPLSITAPGVTTDAFTAEYLSSGYPNDTVMVDSLEYVSDCEYWTLQRVAGTSDVKTTLGWNGNSCGLDNYDDLRVAGWDGSQWTDLGAASITVSDASMGVVTAFTPLTFTLNPMLVTVGKKKSNTPYAVLRRKLDGGYYTATNGKLLFRYDEEYHDTDSKLTFNIYDKQRNLVGSYSYLPSTQPGVTYGDNRYTLNIINCNINIGNGFYVMEVVNEKNEKWYLRFKHQTTISVVCPPTGVGANNQ